MLRKQRNACASLFYLWRKLLTGACTMKILRPNDTVAKIGICDRQLRAMEAEGLFPKRFPLNPNGKGRAVGHLESEVDAWIKARADARETAAA